MRWILLYFIFSKTGGTGWIKTGENQHIFAALLHDDKNRGEYFSVCRPGEGGFISFGGKNKVKRKKGEGEKKREKGEEGREKVKEGSEKGQEGR